MGSPRLMVEAGGWSVPGGEDRLTEVMATALRANRRFVDRLLDQLTVPKSHGVVIRTQEGFSGEPRLIDVVIYGFDEAGDRVAAVFIENKLGSWFSKQQSRRQRAALNRLEPAPESRVLAGIAEDHDLARAGRRDAGVPRYDPRQDYDQVLSWTQIDALARSAGEEHEAPWGGGDWQERAMHPTAPACQRLLHEFVVYLGEEQLLALTADDVVALSRFDFALEGVVDLLMRAAKRLDDYTPVGEDDDIVGEDETTGEARFWSVEFQPASSHWLSSITEGSLDLLVTGAEWNDARGTTKPQIYAGLAFPADRSARDAVENALEWKTAAEAEAFGVYVTSSYVLVYRGKDLEWIATQGDTIEAQADALGTWTRDAFAAAAKLPAPPDIKSARRKKA